MRPQGVCRLTGGYRIRPYGVNRKKCLTILILCAKISQQSFRWLLRPDRMPGAGSRNSEIVMSTYIEYGSFYHDRERGEITMKQGIHPNYVDCTITCACGNVTHTRDTKPEIHVEVCSKCHPVSYTHLDVYKRQITHPAPSLHIIPQRGAFYGAFPKRH